jgi:Bacterial Ig-like domain (group 3)
MKVRARGISITRLVTLMVLLVVTPLVLAQTTPSVVVLTSTPNPVVQGESVTFTAVVVGAGTTAATGTITITGQCSANSVTLGSITLPSQTLSVSTFPCIGENSIVAAYSGDLTYSPGTSETLVETVLPQSTPTSIVLSSSIDPSTAFQSLIFDAALSFPPYCPFNIIEPPGTPAIATSRPKALDERTGPASARGTATNKVPTKIPTAQASGPRNYTINFAGSGVILPTAGSFTYDPAVGFTNFQVQWFGASFDFTAAANNASGCGTSGPALAFALLSQSLTGCPSGTFANYAWYGSELGEDFPARLVFPTVLTGTSRYRGPSSVLRIPAAERSAVVLGQYVMLPRRRPRW